MEYQLRVGVGSIALAQASLGAAASPQPERPPARLANSATMKAQRRIPVFMVASNQTWTVRVNALAPRHRCASPAHTRTA